VNAAGDAPRPLRRAFIGLGSNLGDRLAELGRAVGELRDGGDVAAVSPVYETAPLGGPAGQSPYLNVVVELRTAQGARDLLGRCRALEEAAARVRTVRFGPRTLDADVLWVEGEAVDEADLVVPHPRMRERRFVLAPLAELAPDLVTPDDVAAAEGEVRRAGTLGARSP
jgi:2-amino-4-hydroxy-6-hydroxymethyldihydropteridine diphosphokinase